MKAFDLTSKSVPTTTAEPFVEDILDLCEEQRYDADRYRNLVESDPNELIEYQMVKRLSGHVKTSGSSNPLPDQRVATEFRHEIENIKKLRNWVSKGDSQILNAYTGWYSRIRIFMKMCCNPDKLFRFMFPTLSALTREMVENPPSLLQLIRSLDRDSVMFRLIALDFATFKQSLWKMDLFNPWIEDVTLLHTFRGNKPSANYETWIKIQEGLNHGYRVDCEIQDAVAHLLCLRVFLYRGVKKNQDLDDIDTNEAYLGQLIKAWSYDEIVHHLLINCMTANLHSLIFKILECNSFKLGPVKEADMLVDYLRTDMLGLALSLKTTDITTISIIRDFKQRRTSGEVWITADKALVRHPLRNSYIDRYVERDLAKFSQRSNFKLTDSKLSECDYAMAKYIRLCEPMMKMIPELEKQLTAVINNLEGLAYERLVVYSNYKSREIDEINFDEPISNFEFKIGLSFLLCVKAENNERVFELGRFLTGPNFNINTLVLLDPNRGDCLSVLDQNTVQIGPISSSIWLENWLKAKKRLPKPRAHVEHTIEAPMADIPMASVGGGGKLRTVEEMRPPVEAKFTDADRDAVLLKLHQQRVHDFYQHWTPKEWASRCEVPAPRRKSLNDVRAVAPSEEIAVIVFAIQYFDAATASGEEKSKCASLHHEFRNRDVEIEVVAPIANVELVAHVNPFAQLKSQASIRKKPKRVVSLNVKVMHHELMFLQGLWQWYRELATDYHVHQDAFHDAALLGAIRFYNALHLYAQEQTGAVVFESMLTRDDRQAGHLRHVLIHNFVDMKLVITQIEVGIFPLTERLLDMATTRATDVAVSCPTFTLESTPLFGLKVLKIEAPGQCRLMIMDCLKRVGGYVRTIESKQAQLDKHSELLKSLNRDYDLVPQSLKIWIHHGRSIESCFLQIGELRANCGKFLSGLVQKFIDLCQVIRHIGGHQNVDVECFDPLSPELLASLLEGHRQLQL